MMWFDKQDPRCLFGDIRIETHNLKDRGNLRYLEISPDVQLDFTALPFADSQFRVVVLDPPHLVSAGKQSWLAKKYGTLGGDWQNDLRRAFVECFRVLKPGGVLIFKWNEDQVKVSQILALTPHKPLFGHPTGRHGRTHWFAFLKEEKA
ncbi:methyltransferase domain-containing protein [Neisseria shayeganii]|uniref:Methyltransferase domain-containing protein n=1 Tax=Neisseria shayeganii TaxID=607712 RepID=A0A7D7S749_9NEIS|nr:methyltransferase domain-containing protein [Neisseria shayeganii]QMT39968.1 methyltransferase domain-containing protein [Neisseria shayeganii]